MKMNRKGWNAFDRWHAIYYAENDRLGGDSANGDLVEGWCIIDNYAFIKTLTDECELLVFGYDDCAVDHIDDYIDIYGENDIYFIDPDGNKYTAKEVRQKLLEYYETE